MAKYEDILKEIQGARSVPLEQRLPTPTTAKVSNASKLERLRQIANEEKLKQTQAEANLRNYLQQGGIQTSNTRFSTPNVGQITDNMLKQSRMTLDPKQLTNPIYTDAYGNITNPFTAAQSNVLKYNELMQTDEAKQKVEDIKKQVTKAGYAQYEYDKEAVNQDEIGWYDKSIGNITRGLGSLVDLGGEIYDEKGNSVRLPSKNELKSEKVNESYNTIVGKILGNATYEGTRILASTALNAVVPYAGSAWYFGDMFDSSYNSARREGYDGDKAVLYATLSTASEVIVGKVLGAATKGLTGGKSGAVDTAIKKATSKLLGDNRFTDFLANATAEGLEEFVQEYIDGINKLVTLENSNDIKDYVDVFTDKDTLTQALYSAGIGALTGGALGGRVDVNQDLKTNINKNNQEIAKLNNQKENTKNKAELKKINENIKKLEEENANYNKKIQENIEKYNLKSEIQTVEDLVKQDQQQTAKPIEIDRELQQKLSQPTQLPDNSNTRYSLSKTKQNKQMLEQEFKNLTGDDVLLAQAKMAGYYLRKTRKENGDTKIGENPIPYSQKAIQLLKDIENSAKTSSHLYHSTPADRIQSIIQTGLKIGSKQNQEGVSSLDKLYLSATPELAESFAPNDSVTLRISPNAKLENLDYDLLGGEGSYTITNNIEPNYLQVKENGKWVNLLKSQYANQIKGKSVARDTNIPTTQESVLNVPQNKPKKVLNPTEISNLTPENASTTPILPTTQTITGDKQSRFLNNINRTEMLSKESKNLINNAKIGEYKSVTNEESLKQASEKLEKGGKSETERWFRNDPKNVNATDIAEGFILLNQYQEIAKNSNNSADKYQANQSMVEVAKKLRQIGTEAGQTLQAYTILSRMTPEGMVYYAQSELTDAYNEMIKNKSKQWIDQNRDRFELTPDETQFILDTMQEVSKMEDGYEKKVKLAEIQKLMTDKLPPEKGQKLKSWMRLSMLFNPKTQVRNIAGNALIAPVNSFGDIFASYADKLISKKTKVRTTGKTDIKAILEGFKKGAYEATTDYKKGINTRDIEGNRFEIGDGKSFSDKNIIGKALNNTESLLNYVMDAGDRVFSEAAFENSLQNQLKLNNTTEITQDMIDIARQEALSRTWNDNNNYTKFVLNVRSMLNKINVGTYGLGDVLIPFAKTPANLTKAIVDYSPVGFVNTMLKGRKLSRSLQNGQYTPQLQHEFVQTLGKATAGTMLYVLGMALAKAGITSGESDDDKDTQNFLKNTLGISNYSIKLGNKSFTYDWAQPLAAPLSITANIANRKDKEQALGEAILSNLDTASSVLLEQSFMQGINEVLNGNGGIVDGLINQVLSLPARAIPTLSKQITDLTDSTQRTSFEYGKPVQSAINAAKAKIPGLSQTLAPVVDTMGREVERYGGKNNIFNVFLNPASVNTENISEAASEIYRVYQETGDKTVMPRVAPYYINSKGEKITLNSKQKAEFQTTSGSIIEENMNDLINNQAYQILSDTEKASMINDLVNYAYNKARKDILGIDMSSEYNKINQYVSDGGTPAEYYTNKEEINYAYTNPEKYSTIKQIATYNEYQTYNNTIKDIKEKYSTSDERKSAIINYVNSLELNIPQKAMLIKMYYSSFKQYDNQIIEYINSQDLTISQKSDILKEVGFTIKNGVVYK